MTAKTICNTTLLLKISESQKLIVDTAEWAKVNALHVHTTKKATKQTKTFGSLFGRKLLLQIVI